MAMTYADSECRAYWDKNVQHHIDRIDATAWTVRKGQIAAGTQAEDANHGRVAISGQGDFRADARWRWSGPNISTQLAMIAGARLGQAPERYALCLAWGEELPPLGMLLLAERFTWNGEPNDPLVFVWYISGAPPQALSALKLPLIDGIGPMLIDHAVSRSFHLGFRGRLLLHAAPGGVQPVLEESGSGQGESRPAEATVLA